MKRVLLICALALIGAIPALAQSTTVSGQVQDASTQTWNNGTYTFTFVPNPSYPAGPYTWTGGTLQTTFSGTLSGTGTYSLSLPSNANITPQGSQWTMSVCPQATSPCYRTAAFTATGATTTFNAFPPAIQISLINPPGPFTLAYSDSEISGALIGSQYYNTTLALVRVCNAATNNNCTTWSSIGSGGGGGTVTGTGTANNVSCWSGASVIGNCPDLTDPSGAPNINGPLTLTGTTPTYGQRMQEGDPANCFAAATGFDILCANGTAHQFDLSNNGGPYFAVGTTQGVLDASLCSGAHWTDKVVTCYGLLGGGGGTIIVPDSIADNGSATTPSIPSNVALRFTGSATFQFCNMTIGGFTKIKMYGALLQESGSGCTGINAPTGINLQSLDNLILDGVRVDCNSQTNSTGITLGNNARVVLRDASAGNCTNTGLSASGTQFSNFTNVMLYNNLVAGKLYSILTTGGGSTLDLFNLKLLQNSEGLVFYNPNAGTLAVQNDIHLWNPTLNGNTVNSIAVVSVATAPVTIVYIHGLTSEGNGGGASTITVDGNVIPRSVVYASNSWLIIDHPTPADSSATPWGSAVNGSNITVEDVNGYGNAAGVFLQADLTSTTALTGTTSLLGQAQNLVTYPNSLLPNGTLRTSGAAQTRYTSLVPNMTSYNPLTPVASTLGTGTTCTTATDATYNLVTSCTHAASVGSGSTNFAEWNNILTGSLGVTQDFWVKISVRATTACNCRYEIITTPTPFADQEFTLTNQWQDIRLYLPAQASGQFMNLFAFPLDSSGATVYFTGLEVVTGATNIPATQYLFSQLSATGALNPNGFAIPGQQPVAFSTLPACASGIEGTNRAVNDSTTVTWGATITGGSTNHVQAYCDGTNWTVGAK